MSRILAVAVVQFAASESRAENLDRAAEHIRTAVRQGARLVCLQELFTTRYFCQEEVHERFDLAEPIPGPTTRRMAALAAQLRCAILCPLFERAGAGVYFNSAALIDAHGRLVHLYRKMHIPDDPLYYEKFYFAPGDRGFRVVELDGARVGVLICWDQWFPEAARILALRGAEIILIPTAIGWHDHERAEHGEAQLDAWITVQRAHAIANGAFVAVANRVGREGTVEFWGNSFVCAPFGELLTRAAAEAEGAWVAECALERVEHVRRHWPFLRDRRVDAYAPLLCRYAAGGPDEGQGRCGAGGPSVEG